MTIRPLLSLTAAALLSATALAQKTPILITADLTDAPRKLYHAEVDLPVAAGPLTLTTPEWIPGNHAPTGPANQIVGVVFTAGGKTLAWRRDDVDLYQFHLTIPAGVTTLHAHLDCIVAARITTKIAVLEWEKLLLYPANIPVKDIAVQPSVKVPEGWGIGTALTPIDGDDPQHPKGGTTHYTATTVEQLEDSPIIAGQYFHEFPLAPEVKPAHFIDVVSDAPEDANLKPELLASLSNLVRETGAAYASRHLQRLSLPAHALRRRRRRRSRARPVLRQRRRRKRLRRRGPHPLQRRSALPRVHSLLERQVPPPPPASTSRTSLRRNKARCCGSTRA